MNGAFLAVFGDSVPWGQGLRDEHKPATLVAKGLAAKFPSLQPVMLAHSGAVIGANWIHLGQTTGRGRMDREHQAHGQAVKDIYIYPLVHNARQQLCSDLAR